MLNLDYRGRTVRTSAEPGLQRRRDWGTVRQGQIVLNLDYRGGEIGELLGRTSAEPGLQRKNR